MWEVLWNVSNTWPGWLCPAGSRLSLHCEAEANGEADQMLIYWLVNEQFPEDAPSHGRIVELEEWVSSESHCRAPFLSKCSWGQTSCGWAGCLFQGHSEERHSPAEEFAVEEGQKGRPQLHLHLRRDKCCRKHEAGHHLKSGGENQKNTLNVLFLDGCSLTNAFMEE